MKLLSTYGLFEEKTTASYIRKANRFNLKVFLMVSGTRFLEKTFMKDTEDGKFFVESIKLISLDIFDKIFHRHRCLTL
jgi:hypothetical protein